MDNQRERRNLCECNKKEKVIYHTYEKREKNVYENKKGKKSFEESP